MYIPFEFVLVSEGNMSKQGKVTFFDVPARGHIDCNDGYFSLFQFSNDVIPWCPQGGPRKTVTEIQITISATNQQR